VTLIAKTVQPNPTREQWRPEAVSNDPYRVLWLSVILKIIEDFSLSRFGEGYFDTHDFKLACELASVDPVEIFGIAYAERARELAKERRRG
jgi:hypothetical protein